MFTVGIDCHARSVTMTALPLNDFAHPRIVTIAGDPKLPIIECAREMGGRVNWYFETSDFGHAKVVWIEDPIGSKIGIVKKQSTVAGAVAMGVPWDIAVDTVSAQGWRQRLGFSARASKAEVNAWVMGEVDREIHGALTEHESDSYAIARAACAVQVPA